MWVELSSATCGNRLYDRIPDLPLAFFQKERTGVLMSRITNDVNILKAMVSTAVTGTMRDASSIVGLAAVILYQNWRLAIIAFVVMPLAFLPVVEFGRRVVRRKHRVPGSHGRIECLAP